MRDGSTDGRGVGRRRKVFGMEENGSSWLDQAGLTLAAAENMLAGGLPGEAITNAFLGMLYAARYALEGGGGGISGWEEVLECFQAEAPSMSLSKENQRALPIVADLYRRVSGGEMDADPVTAAACLRDARSFMEEIAARGPE